MQATGISGEDRFYTGLGSGGAGDPATTVWLGGRNVPGTGASPTTGGTAAAPGGAADQASVQAGVATVRHSFLTAADANTALQEWQLQVQAAETKRLHREGQSGEERQVFAQVTFSGTTQQWTVNFGGQEQFVFVLPANLQLSLWAQAMAGTNVSSGVAQGSAAAGLQLIWQPNNWFAAGGQVGSGPTVQAVGPSSIDSGALLFLQLQQ